MSQAISWREAARRSSESVLRGHRQRSPSIPARAPSRRPSLAALIERACDRHPTYRTDGTRAMLVTWAAEGRGELVRSFVAKALTA